MVSEKRLVASGKTRVGRAAEPARDYGTGLWKREGGRETVLKNLGLGPSGAGLPQRRERGSRGRGSGRARDRPAAATALSSHVTGALAFGPPNALEGLDTEVVAVSVHPVTDPATGTPASRKFPRGWSFPGNSPVTFPFCEPASLSLVPCLHGLSVRGWPVSLLPRLRS